MKTLYTDRFGVTFYVKSRKRPVHTNTGRIADAVALNMAVHITQHIPPDGNRHALSIDSARIDGHIYRIYNSYVSAADFIKINTALTYGTPYHGMTGGILFNHLFASGFVEAVRLH